MLGSFVKSIFLGISAGKTDIADMFDGNGFFVMLVCIMVYAVVQDSGQYEQFPRAGMQESWQASSTLREA